jgi:hypothetical protein
MWSAIGFLKCSPESNRHEEKADAKGDGAVGFECIQSVHAAASSVFVSNGPPALTNSKLTCQRPASIAGITRMKAVLSRSCFEI